MSTTKKSPRTVVLDPDFIADADAVDTLEYPTTESASAFSDEIAASMCPSCGELLAWHDEPCGVAPMSLPTPSDLTLEDPTDTVPFPAPSRFTYALGQPVQPAPATQAGKVIWRGQVKERHPHTGLLHRVNVYRLDNGYWDCYYEAELQATLKLPTQTLR